MDTRRISAGLRRRVGQTPGMYDNVKPGLGQRSGRTKTVGNTEMETDMSIIEGHFAERRSSHDAGRA